MKNIEDKIKEIIKKLLNNLGIKGYCKNCGTALVFDRERFELGYSARSECPVCDINAIGRFK